MELAQHILLHTIALINNGESRENVVEKFENGIEECWIADTYLKKHMDKVWDRDNLSDEYIIEKIQKLLSPEDLEEELEIQIKICSDAVENIYQSKNFETLKNNEKKILEKESIRIRKI